MIKRTLSCALIICVMLSLFSCGDSDDIREGGVVLEHCELRLPLPDGYYGIESDIYDKVYTNGEYMIALTRMSFDACANEGIPSIMSESEFAEFYLKKCEREANVNTDPIVYADYFDSNGSDEHYYMETFYRSPYAYFIILFASDVSRAEDASEDFFGFAKQVYFTIITQ